jgi:hypothetical protein
MNQVEHYILKNFESFNGICGLKNMEIEQYKARRAAALFLLNFKKTFISLLSKYSYDCIYAGSLVFWLLETRPVIVIGAEPRTYQCNSLREAVNEEFALFNALAILKIKQGYVTNKTLLPDMVRSFCLHGERGSLSIESLVEDMERLCNGVPDYMPNKQ